VKLADTAAERDLYESLAEIYSIIITLEALEKAYLRDSIKESEYTETCDRLLRQYKSNLADDHVHAAFGDLDRFKAEWDVCCLIYRGRHAGYLADEGNSSTFQRPQSD
jgi:ESCRT-I complex subunit VPS28